MHIFQEALLALLPAMERAHIRWREPDAYDDWDEIAEALFNNIVVRSIAWTSPDAEAPMVPRYNMVYEHYATMSFIEVVTAGKRRPPYLLFHSFSSTTAPFDTVKCRAIDATGTVIGEDFVCLPADRARFQLQRRTASAALHPQKALVVLL
jgi:hypothetical protein